MRNLKRVLSLALALVMVLGMMVITTSAADFNDAEEITYTEAMDVMAGVGLYKGDENGNVNPDQILSREDAATLMARIMLGDKTLNDLTPTKQIFADVATDRWSAAAIEYCYNIDMIGGYTDANGDLVFNPKGELTGTAFAKLLLCAMGYDAGAEGYEGAAWEQNINADALTAKLMLKGVNISAPLTREGAAQMILQALSNKMVEYRTSYDYATGAAVLTGPFDTSKTFQAEYFSNLQKVSGVITAVNSKGTVLNGTTVTAKNVDWTDIGYQAYNWVVKNVKESTLTRTSISDVYITGTSMGVNTNGAKFTALIDNEDDAFVAEMDYTYQMFYNGVLAAAYEYTYDNDGYIDDIVLSVKDATVYAEYKAALGKVGTKVDFVDNDNQGKAEAVVVTEYTFTQVRGVQLKSVSGEISTAYYALANGVQIKPANLKGVDALNRGDFVTYVKYGADYYVTVLESNIAEFEDITRDKLNNENVKVYTIGGADYIASELNTTNIGYLTNANTNNDVIYVADEYGYLVYAVEYVDPDAYLYVLNNNHTDTLEGTTKASAVFTDGTDDIIYIASIVDFGSDFNNGVINKNDNQIHSYKLDKNGNYVLTRAGAVVLTGDYEEDDIVFDGYDLTDFTTIVDIRKDTFGTVYTGYNELPDIDNAKIVALVEDGAVVLGYLVEGKDPAESLKASFIVFNTETNVADSYKVNGKTYVTYELEAGVILNGDTVPTENYILSAEQKADIDKYGVGVYTYDDEGTLTAYTSFVEKTNVKWTPKDWGKVIIGTKDVTDDYTTVILDISKGEVGEWDQLVKEGYYYSYIGGQKKDVLYLVGDATIADGGILAPNGAVTGSIDTVDYVAADGYVTRVGTELTVAKATLNGSDELKNMTNTNDVYTAMVTGAYNVGETVTVTATRKTGGIFVDGANYVMTLDNGETAMAEGDGTAVLDFDFTVTAATTGDLKVESIARGTVAATIADVQALLAAGKDVVLSDDLTISASDMIDDAASIPVGIFVSKDTVLDLNGYDIIMEDIGETTAAIFAHDANLTIIGEGTITQEYDAGYVLWAKGESTVDIYGGTYDAPGSDTTILYASGNVAYSATDPWATINVYGGTFTNASSDVQDLANVMNHGVGRINFCGGTYNWDPDATNYADDEAYIVVPTGYTVVDNNDGTWTVEAE